ncbi:MAG: response regulator transcription factor [Ignavibacteriaceae bacterium]|nr:response regulator transcription factor [Ignavibacteriaceae bacterium]
MKKVLLVEDSVPIAQGVQLGLTDENFETDISYDGEEGFQKAIKGPYDIILLDLMLPHKNGIDICRDLRKEDVLTPIIILTSRKTETDKILGLEVGADDYVTKPFSIKELIARMRAVMRRSEKTFKETEDYSFGNVQIHFKQMEACKSGIPVKLTTTEFKIMKYFSQHEGVVITRDNFLDDVWGYDSFPTTRTVDNYILSLRKKIEDDPANPVHLITVHSAGYKFVK